MSCGKCFYSEEIINHYEWGCYHCKKYNRKRLAEMSCDHFKERSNKDFSRANKTIQVYNTSNISF